MKRISIGSFWLAVLLLGTFARGQQSANTVKYTVSYNASTQVYTAILMPDYNVPNGNNSQNTEKGATAQFTIVVPKDFTITEVTDIRGTWTKADDLLKLGPGQPGQDWSGYSLNPALNYYAIGKAATETDYGSFVVGQQVTLFSFKGNGCFGPISPLAPNDPFINAADQAYALNVANSFNSRSGQPAGGNQRPLEQFVNITGTAATCSSTPEPPAPIVLTANPDNGTITAGGTAVTPVLANDTNTGQPASTANVTVSITTQPPVGTVVVNGDGTISFTPPANFTGVVCYSYRICDLTSTTACSAPAQVCITVQATIPPVVVTANPDNGTITAGGTATTPVLANDTNTGQPASTANVTVSITTQPPVGTVVVNGDGTISFTPPANFTGVACYSYRICDLISTTACSAPAQVCITVQATIPPVVVTANPDNGTITAGGTATTPVLANDTNTGQPASTANVTVSITTQPPVGTVVVNGDGTISFTPPANFTGVVCYSYRICDLISTTACSAPVQVCITVNPRPVGNADIRVTKRVVGNRSSVIGEIVTFEIIVKNLGSDGATNVVVKDSLTSGLQFRSASVTTGSGTYANPLLTIPALASGDSTVFRVVASVMQDGISFNYARLVSLDQTDANAANNRDQSCVSVPVNLCSGQAIVASVPGSFTNVTWFKGNVVVATGNTITLTEGGTYTFTASNATCPAEGCCPLVIVQSDCCPVNACVPFVITKTRTR